jgi:SSS family solute:Na+ symporter
MAMIDYLIVGGYLLFALTVGVAMSKKATKGAASYFLGDRSLPWWAIGVSLVATSFASDTPILVTEIVRDQGLQRLWWILAWVMMLIVGIFLFSRLWRRAHIITDAQFYELRYEGRSATFLRAFRAFFSGIVQNVVTMGWVTLAMSRIVTTMTGLDYMGALGVCLTVAVVYSLLSGFYGVVITDVVQFFVAMISMAWLAVAAIWHVGGSEAMQATIIAKADYDASTLQLFPDWTHLDQNLLQFLILITVLWCQDVNGYNMQRISACRNERDSVKAMIFYAIFQTVRPWMWAAVGLVSIVLFPQMPEGYSATDAYPMVMNTVLGPGMRGLLITAFLAAFMSTIDTHLNWGASYLMTDVYTRFIKLNPSRREYMLVTRLAVVMLMGLVLLVVPWMNSVSAAWEFFNIMIIGYGIVSFARWFWWRVNANTEIAALATGIIAATAHTLFSTVFPKALVIYGVPWPELDFTIKIGLVTTIALPIFLVVTLATPPVSQAKLEAFYKQCRPGGFWGGISPQVRRLPGRVLSWATLLDVGGGLALCYGISVAVGYALLTHYWAMSVALAAAVLGAARVYHWYRREIRELKAEGQPGAHRRL